MKDGLALEEKPGGSTDVKSARPWRVGTLTYTTAGLVVLFAWLLWGDFAWSMKDRTVGPVLQILLKKYQASDLLTSMLLGSLPPLVGIIIGPIISYKSDQHRGRWGRRIPYLLMPTPVVALAMLGLAFAPETGAFLHKILGSHSPGIDSTTLFMLGLLWTTFEFSTTVANSVFGGLINDVVPQRVIGLFYGAFRALSLIAGIIFGHWFFGLGEAHYSWVFGGMGLLYGVGFTIMCLKVKEGEYPPPHVPAERHGIRAFFAAAKQYLRDCYTHSYYWMLYLYGALAGFSLMPFNLFAYYYAKTMAVDDVAYGNYGAIMYTVSLVLALPLGWLADRVHPLKLTLYVLVAMIMVMLWGGLYARDPHTFAIAFILHGVLAGTWYTSSASLGQRLFPREKFAQMASAGGIIGAIGSILLSPLVGKYIEYAHHEYRYTFFIEFGLALAGLCFGLVLYRMFLGLGGPKNYQAPV